MSVNNGTPIRSPGEVVESLLKELQLLLAEDLSHSFDHGLDAERRSAGEVGTREEDRLLTCLLRLISGPNPGARVEVQEGNGSLRVEYCPFQEDSVGADVVTPVASFSRELSEGDLRNMVRKLLERMNEGREDKDGRARGPESLRRCKEG